MLYKIIIFLLMCSGAALGSKVLMPIKDGEDVGVVIVAGGNLYYYQYEELGLAIQEASPQRLWVHLSDNNLYSGDGTYASANDTVIGQGIHALLQAGLPEAAPVIAYGHSYGGVLIIAEAEVYPELVAGLVILGLYSYRPFAGFPVPLMTTNGDLDGNARITQTMQTFKDVKDNFEQGDGSYMTRYPHALMTGVNHMAYVTGNFSETADQFWINAEVSDEESRRLVGVTTAPFVVHHTSKNSTEVENAAEALKSMYNDTDEYMRPLLTAFYAEEDADNQTSPWTQHAQMVIANLEEGTSDQLTVNNSVVSNSQLESQQPSVTTDLNSGACVATLTSLRKLPGCGLYVAACGLAAKMKSSQSINEALSGQSEPEDLSVLCREVNMAAFDWVLNNLVMELPRERFMNRNITVEFLQDVFAESESTWLNADLLFDFNGMNLDIQSTNYITSTDSPDLPGMHHCHLLSPARAIEFIYVDALYENMYNSVF